MGRTSSRVPALTYRMNKTAVRSAHQIVMCLCLGSHLHHDLFKQFYWEEVGNVVVRQASASILRSPATPPQHPGGLSSSRHVVFGKSDERGQSRQ